MEKNWDLGSGMEKIRIRHKHAGSTTLLQHNIFFNPTGWRRGRGGGAGVRRRGGGAPGERTAGQTEADHERDQSKKGQM
jgi:hypothetical protein